MIVVDEPGLCLLQYAGHFHEDAGGAVDQDVVDLVVREQRLQRAITHDFVERFPRQHDLVGGGQGNPLAGDVLGHVGPNEIFQLAALGQFHLDAFLVQPVDQVRVHLFLQLLVFFIDTRNHPLPPATQRRLKKPVAPLAADLRAYCIFTNSASFFW